MIETGRLPSSAVASYGSEPRAATKDTASPQRSLSKFVSLAKARIHGMKKSFTENDWTVQVDKLVLGEPSSRAVILGPSSLSLGQRAFRRSLRNNPWLPQVVEIRSSDAVHTGSAPSFCPGDLAYVTDRAAQLFDLTRLVETAGTILIEGANGVGGQKLTEMLFEQR